VIKEINISFTKQLIKIIFVKHLFNKKMIRTTNILISILLLLCICFLPKTVSSQLFKSNTELGIKGGLSYYTGDLNSKHFNSANPAASFIVRRNIDRRFSLKAEISILKIDADDRESDDIIRLDRGLHFRSSIQELSSQIEFNFLPFEVGSVLYDWTPFIFSGISIYNFNPEAENSIGQWVDLQPLATEGQGTTAYPDRKKYSRTQIAIPMGGGVKISLNNNLNIAFSFSARKTYTDYLDDVSTTYPGTPTEFGASNIEMSDPMYTHAKDEQRGNELKDDWYYYSGITISFKLNNDTKGCNYE
jgi:hypothetical protein